MVNKKNSRVKLYSKTSSVMDVNITFGHEQFTFNLYDEIIISEEKINKEVMDQPSAYSFLLMLSKRLLNSMKDKEKEMEKRFSEVYVAYKKKLNPDTQRPYDKDYAYHIANASVKYQTAKEEYLRVKNDYETIITCVESFNQRSYLLQTLSANVRKNKE